MNDPIVAAYLSDFKKTHDIESSDAATSFEHFVNYCAVAKRVADRFEVESVHTGGGDDLGIDGFAILINGRLVSSPEEVEDLAVLGAWEVRFVAVQSKSGEKFRGADMDNFLSGVLEFFQPSAVPFPVSASIAELRRIVGLIYDKAIRFSALPILETYYATTGAWTGNAHLEARVARQKDALAATKLFSVVKFEAFDADSLKDAYRELRRMAQREIRFETVATLPELPGAPQAFLGLISTTEYLKLVSDSGGDLLPYLFYDNVRDFQGENAVNGEIQRTLDSADARQWLPLLNNGVTVISRNLRQVGQRYILQDFQVVNGCQTTHILHRNRTLLEANPTLLPLKLIQSDRAELTRKIIRATNRQTEVKDEAFEALNPFHTELEEFFQSMRHEFGVDLFYERRSKQYASDESVKEYQIVSLAGVLKAFVAMYCDEPHSTPRYYGEILKAYRSRVFQDGHQHFPYFVGALCYRRIERALLRGALPRWARDYRYHLMMLIRLYAEQVLGIDPRSDDGCRILVKTMLDDAKFDTDLHYLVYLCEGKLPEDARARYDAARRRQFTDVLRETLLKAHPKKAQQRRPPGR